MTYRQIDARGIWAGDSAALQTFRKAFEHDCESDESLFLSVYGWKQEALTDALRKSNAKPLGYLAISDDYSYAPMRVGLVVRRNTDGKEIYCQPGDDENAMRENIDMAHGIWITLVRDGETENQDFIPFGKLHVAELQKCRDEFESEMFDGDTIEEYEGEN